MAGDWIKVDVGLDQKPEVLRLANILGKNRFEIIGYLLKFWVWVDRNSVDGVVDGVVASDIDDVVGVPGFGDGLVKVRWLQFDGNDQKMTIPKFSRHNGESAKKRALKSERQARWRGASASTSATTAVDVMVSTPPSTREEKNREEINTTSSLRSDVSPLQPVLKEQPLKDTTPVTSTTPRGSRFKMVKLPSAWAQFCREKRPDLDPAAVFESFRDYWVARAGEKGVKLDWQATWRNWVRKEKRGGNGQTPGEVMANWAEAEIDRL